MSAPSQSVTRHSYSTLTRTSTILEGTSVQSDSSVSALFEYRRKTDNVLINLKEGHWIPTIIDFGKESYISVKKKYPPLSEIQVQKYNDNYPHIAPELYIRGLEKSVSSDIYSLGWMLKDLEHCFFGKIIKEVFQKCLHKLSIKKTTIYVNST